VLKHFAERVGASWRAAATEWSGNGSAARTHNELSEVLERSSDCVIQTDVRGGITYCNPTARSMLGWRADSASPSVNLSHFAAAGTLRQMVDVVLPAVQTHGVWVGEIAMRLPGRRRVPFSLMALAHRGQDGQAIRYSAVMRDISADVKARLHIQRQNDVLSAITEALPATVVIVDSQGCYRFVNSAFERYVGLPASRILGRTAVDVLGAEEVARRRPYMRRAIAGEPVEFLLDYPGPAGATYLSLHCIPLSLDGMVDGFVGISQDVTMQRREQARLADLAERDPLTGLFNRSGFEQRALPDTSANEGVQHALLYIDLDHFKQVNDRLGHATGDRLLQMFAVRLREAVRSSDVVARLGGDEFVILLRGASLQAAEAVADKVLAAASTPFEIEGRDVLISASIGVALISGSESVLAEAMAEADNLLYRAKAAGRGRHSSVRALAAQTAAG